MSEFTEALGKTALNMQTQHYRMESWKGILGGIIFGIVGAIIGVIVLIIGISAGQWVMILAGFGIVVIAILLGWLIYHLSKKRLEALNKTQPLPVTT